MGDDNRKRRRNVASAQELLPKTWIERLGIDLFRFIRKGFARVAELAPTRLNVSWVDEDLAVGGVVPRRDIPKLRRLGVRAIVDCREEAEDDQATLAANNIAYLRLPTPDAHELSQDSLQRGVAWVREKLAGGGKVYIHCHHGVGRAPLLASCVLVADGLSAQDALRLVKSRRWQASPNEEQLQALVTYAQRLDPAGPKDQPETASTAGRETPGNPGAEPLPDQGKGFAS
jgi:protein-tyrosine phosphatase